MSRRGLLLFLCGLCLGCSYQDLGGYSSDTPLSDLPDPTKRETELRVVRLAQALAAWEARRSEEGVKQHVLGPSDVVEVSIYALEAPGQTSAFTRTVSEEGTVALPWVGAIEASKLTDRQLEERIAAAYAGGYLRDPQVIVRTLERHSGGSVIVTGAVGEPGVYSVSGRGETILEILALAGGVLPEAGDELLIIRGAGSGGPTSETLVPPDSTEHGTSGGIVAGPDWETVVVDLDELVEEGNLTWNLEVVDGDVITVPRSVDRHIYVLGFVQRPGVYKLARRVPVDALQALAMAGGPGTMGRAQSSFLVRQVEDGPVVVSIDLVDMARGKLSPVYLQGGDALVVGTSALARMSPFLKPSAAANVTATAAP